MGLGVWRGEGSRGEERRGEEGRGEERRGEERRGEESGVGLGRRAEGGGLNLKSAETGKTSSKERK